MELIIHTKAYGTTPTVTPGVAITKRHMGDFTATRYIFTDYKGQQFTVIQIGELEEFEWPEGVEL